MPGAVPNMRPPGGIMATGAPPNSQPPTQQLDPFGALMWGQ